jgi:hypothetical protein
VPRTQRTNRRTLRARAFASALLLACEACSGIFVRAAPRQETGSFPECTASRAAPIADTVVAGAATVLGITALGATIDCSRTGDCGESAGPAVLVLTGLVLAGAGMSALYGFYQTNRCRDARTTWCESHDCGPFIPAPTR